jgi:inosine/xanthosine triphosphatase
VLVVVGSTNPVKVRATSNVFRKFHASVRVIGLDVKTGTPTQPIGLEATVSGAIRRAREARRLRPDSDFSVGIEAGLVPVPFTMTGYMDQQFAAILDREGEVTLGGGSSFEYPSAVLARVLRDGVEVGRAMDEFTGISELGRRQGAIGYLSRGALNRTRLTEQAVLMALVPRLSRDLCADKRGIRSAGRVARTEGLKGRVDWHYYDGWR